MGYGLVILILLGFWCFGVVTLLVLLWVFCFVLVCCLGCFCWHYDIWRLRCVRDFEVVCGSGLCGCFWVVRFVGGLD